MDVEIKLNDKQFKAFDLLTDYGNGITEVLYGGGARGGKCLGKGTKVRMYDLSVKSVEDIVVGDVLMGDDGTPRNVLSVNTGIEQMYWVRQRNGMDYRVNESHILSLRHETKRTKIHRGNGRKIVDKCEKIWETENISVRDYLKKPNKYKKEAKGYRSFGMDFAEEEVPLDPYFLGVWLLNGISSEITFNDKEKVIKEYCDTIAEGFHCYPHQRKSKARGCMIVDYTTGKKNRKNELLDCLRKLNLLRDKHIPSIYIKNSRVLRLQLLAGLIDADGELHNGCYEITTKSPLLKDGIVNLCGTIGFVTRCNDKCVYGKRYYRIAIIGNNLKEIPCKVERKRSGTQKHRQNANHTGVVVEKDTVDRYYGFTLDGNHLFCLEDYTVTHNTWLGCIWQILRRIALPGSVGFIARKEFSRLVDTTMKTFFDVLSMLGLSDYGYYQSSAARGKSANAYYFPNGSMIYFRYIDHDPQDVNFDRFGSYSLTDMFIDEAQEIEEKAISVLRGRFSLLRGENSDGSEWVVAPKCLYSCNPKRNWIYNDFVKPEKEGNLKPYRAFIKALPKDNPHLEKSFLENLLRSDKVTVQRLYYGNFEYDDDPSALCDFDAIRDLFTNDHIKPVGAHSGAADIAGKGHDRFVAGSWVGNVCYIKIDMDYSPGKVVETKIKDMMINEGIPRSFMIVDADGIGSFLESYLTGIKEFHGNGRPIDTRYANIKAECAFKLAELINKRAIKIVCTEEQKERIMDELAALKQANIDDDLKKYDIEKKDEIKKSLGHSPDYLDMLIMSMYFRRQKPSAGATMRVQTRRND